MLKLLTHPLTSLRLFVLTAVLLCAGCGGTTISSPEDIRTSEGIVIKGFNEDPCILTSSKVVRVGTYYDFSEYDSLQISFTAERLSHDLPFDEILVRVGPTTYLRDSLYASQETVSLSVSVPGLAKPKSSALSFWTPDPQTVLQLSDLRVVGRTSK